MPRSAHFYSVILKILSRTIKGEIFQYLARVNDEWSLILQDNVPKRVPSRICSSVFVDLAPSIVLPRTIINEDEYLWITNMTRDETELFLSGQKIGQGSLDRKVVQCGPIEDLI